MHTLEAKNLCKAFTLSERQRRTQDVQSKKKIAVDDISFTAHSGEVFGLLGPNGAGKTTTMRMLATLISPDNGDVLYDGQSIKSDPIAIKNRFAFLTTDLQLDKKATPNDMFDYFAGLYHVPSDKAAQRKKELFGKFGIDSFADNKISKLSQGMRQKVSLVISVIHDPDFIIFDEPTNGLDIIASRDVRDFILDMKAQGKCMIISTHLFDLVEKICDRAAMIVDGKIVVNDTLENLMQGQSLEDSFYDIYTKYKNK
ncbi:MAG: ABC transporter ATP-binding protein [Clostridiales bacterium]|nr:ABC transporter ATP-binding protein [Clostridiales bacterium]